MRMWIRGAGLFWHVEKSSEPGYALCGKYIYSPWGLEHKVCERPSELENRVCKKCDASVNKKSPVVMSNSQGEAK